MSIIQMIEHYTSKKYDNCKKWVFQSREDVGDVSQDTSEVYKYIKRY